MGTVLLGLVCNGGVCGFGFMFPPENAPDDLRDVGLLSDPATGALPGGIAVAIGAPVDERRRSLGFVSEPVCKRREFLLGEWSKRSCDGGGSATFLSGEAGK